MEIVEQAIWQCLATDGDVVKLVNEVGKDIVHSNFFFLHNTDYESIESNI